tara:strand:+ start:130 stop:423 length:294 start_codon:yes stop_codon:yes gene_type:complete
MNKKILLPDYIDVLWGYTLDGDLLSGVAGLAVYASEMREHYIEHKTDQIAKKKHERGYLTIHERELLTEMLDYMLNRAEAFYENAEDIRAAFEEEVA